MKFLPEAFLSEEKKADETRLEKESQSTLHRERLADHAARKF